MFQIRIHGRGGQGVVTGAALLSVAAFIEGRHAQAFPSLGSERMGAPVTAFCRIADREIRLREPVLAPDALIIQDPALLHEVDVFDGLSADGVILINSKRSFGELGIADMMRGGNRRLRCTVPATELAMKHTGRPLPNTALLGGFAAISRQIRMESVAAAIRQEFPRTVAERNIAAAEEAFTLLSRAEECVDA